MMAANTTKTTKPTQNASKQSKSGHGKGAVAQLVTQLLTGEKTSHLDYAEIAERVRKKIPEAKTSTRSVACVAHALRSAGMDVPDRRSKH